MARGGSAECGRLLIARWTGPPPANRGPSRSGCPAQTGRCEFNGGIARRLRPHNIRVTGAQLVNLGCAPKCLDSASRNPSFCAHEQTAEDRGDSGRWNCHWLGRLFDLVTVEPRYRGRRITSWLEDYPRYKQQDWREAEAAIRSFGTNGIPYILQHFRKRDPFWRNAHTRSWFRSPVWLKRILGPPTFRNTFDIAYAPETFALIGPASIPALNDLLGDTRSQPPHLSMIRMTIRQIDLEAVAKPARE